MKSSATFEKNPSPSLSEVSSLSDALDRSKRVERMVIKEG
ncbi:unnamed protein product [Spirodela intermedia]|uniref:Uncharacterized protein n=2 Tax=Spirodela intermedia TaxID=51605 RepID=A0A7I8K712_SPIIN|nr:unnamed protein product [Spirodela intermedia]CAA6657400.1 unnamed protein product [Spirodela intermedia]CAA7393458.1 unnamed protein product [Spirodela intermedia]